MTGRHTFSSFLGMGLVLALAGVAEAGDTMYTLESAPLFAKQKGKILGQLPPGTPVEVLARKKGKVEVALEGWTEEYRELEVFAGKELRIERASLVRIDPKRHKVLSKENGRFEVVWTKVRLTGWVDSRRLTKKQDKVWKPARDIHQSRCTECHDFMPTSELTAQQWSGTLRIMAHRAALTPEESVLLKQYLQNNARGKGD